MTKGQSQSAKTPLQALRNTVQAFILRERKKSLYPAFSQPFKKAPQNAYSKRLVMNQNAARAMSKTRPSDLLKLALLQLVGSLAFSVVLYFCFDTREAVSAFLGGLIAVLASLFSAWQLARGGQHLQPQAMLMRFYISTILKVAFSLAMMAICVIVMKVSMLPFIIAYLLSAVVVNWLALLFLKEDA